MLKPRGGGGDETAQPSLCRRPPRGARSCRPGERRLHSAGPGRRTPRRPSAIRPDDLGRARARGGAVAALEPTGALVEIYRAPISGLSARSARSSTRRATICGFRGELRGQPEPGVSGVPPRLVPTTRSSGSRRRPPATICGCETRPTTAAAACGEKAIRQLVPSFRLSRLLFIERRMGVMAHSGSVLEGRSIRRASLNIGWHCLVRGRLRVRGAGPAIWNRKAGQVGDAGAARSATGTAASSRTARQRERLPSSSTSRSPVGGPLRRAAHGMGQMPFRPTV